MDSHKIIQSESFLKLVVKRWTISIILTLAILTIYFGFILIIAFKKSLLAVKIGTTLTLGIPVGLGIIVFAWILTGIYVYWANNHYDKSVNEIKEQFLKDNSK